MFQMLYRHNKKEQDQLPAHTYEEAQKGKKKSSVLIQLSGWLRTLDMVREAGLEFDRIIHPRSILPHDVEQ